MCEQCGYFDRYANCNKPDNEACPLEEREEELISTEDDQDDNFEEELELPF